MVCFQENGLRSNYTLPSIYHDGLTIKWKCQFGGVSYGAIPPTPSPIPPLFLTLKPRVNSNSWKPLKDLTVLTGNRRMRKADIQKKCVPKKGEQHKTMVCTFSGRKCSKLCCPLPFLNIPISYLNHTEILVTNIEQDVRILPPLLTTF